jgi:hypothetical protein
MISRNIGVFRFPQNAGIGVAILGIGALVYRFRAAPRSET